MALFLGRPWWACTRKIKPIWILLKQETVSGSGIGWAICKSAPRSRQITMPVPHRSVFYRPDALHPAQPTPSMHWRQTLLSGSASKSDTCSVKLENNSKCTTSNSSNLRLQNTNSYCNTLSVFIVRNIPSSFLSNTILLHHHWNMDMDKWGTMIKP